MDLLDYRANVFSQKGEDGILGRLIDILGLAPGWCVEFGAADGRHLSNTRHLILQQGWSAVLIEGNSTRFAGLRETYADMDRVTCLNQLVGLAPDCNLDAILGATPIPRDFHLLSVDIDSNDYHVWDDLTKYSPRIVVIEFNPTIPNPVDYVQPRDPNVHHGSSLRALIRLGKKKGYELVCSTGLNGIFVHRDLYPRLGIADNSIDALNREQNLVTYLFVCYDGTLKLAGNRGMVWHKIKIDEEKIQMLPPERRIYPGRVPSTSDTPESGR